MNEKLTELLEKLALKLGTTTEFLWVVLVKEAHLVAITDLIYIAMAIIAWIPMWKTHFYLLNVKNQINYDNNDWTGIVIIILAVILLVLTLATLANIGEIIDGFFNPEFWALNYILSMLSKD